MTDELRSRIVAGAPLDELRRIARASGMVPLAEDGWRLARAGLTTADEVLRVVGDE